MNRIKKAVLKMLLKGVTVTDTRGVEGAGYVPVTFGAASDAVTKGYNANADVYSIISFICRKAAAIPWHLYENKQGEQQQVHEHALLSLLQTPNKKEGQGEFLEQLLGYKLITGDSYIWTPLTDTGMNAGKPAVMWVLPAHLVTPEPVDMFKLPSYYRITYNNMRIPAKEVIHMKAFNPDNRIDKEAQGLSPLHAGSKSVNRSNANNDASLNAYKNMGARGIISREGGDVDNLTAEQAEQVNDLYQRRYGGTGKWGKVIVTSGALKWQQIGLSPVDMGMHTDKIQIIRELCNIYHLNSALFNDPDNKVYSNSKEARKAAYTDAIIPEITMVQHELNRHLVPLFGENLQLRPDFSGIPELQEDMEMLAKALGQCWWIKGIDKQRMQGTPVDPDMDAYFIPSSYIRLEDFDEIDESKLLDLPGGDYK